MENQMFNDKAQNDALIVEQVQKGNSQAYNLLVIKYQHKIRDVALKFTNNQADASDIAQEAFIKAYRAIGSFRGECSFYTWIYRITVNTAKSFLESNSKHRYAVDVDAPEFESQDTQGVLNEDKKIIQSLTLQETNRLIEKGVISGGMIPKVEACLDCISNGVEKAHIIDGRIPHSLLLELFTSAGIGSEFVGE